MDEDRIRFTAAAITGLCSTPLGAMAATDPAGPGKIALLAVNIADAVIKTLEMVPHSTQSTWRDGGR